MTYSIFLILFIFSTVSVTAETDPKCVVDPSLDSSVLGNYMDCTAEEMVAIGKTECCTMEGSVGCCKPGERWDQMIAIGVGIGVTFVVLATLCFYCLWCKVDTIPCLGRLQKRLERRYYVVEEKLPCCASRVERRKMEEEIMERSKDQPAFSLPPDVQDKTNKDEWAEFLDDAKERISSMTSYTGTSNINDDAQMQ